MVLCCMFCHIFTTRKFYYFWNSNRLNLFSNVVLIFTCWTFHQVIFFILCYTYYGENMKNSTRDNIKGLLFVFWFILTFFCAIAFKGHDFLELFIFGQAFFIFGLVGLLSTEKISRDDYFIFLFILVGLTLVEISVVGIIKKEHINRMLPSIITNSIILLGLLIVMFERKNEVKPKIKTKKRRLSDFKTTKKGKVILYQRSYRYNIRDLSLIRETKEEKINLVAKTEYITQKVKKDNFTRNLGIFFIILGVLIRLLFI